MIRFLAGRSIQGFVTLILVTILIFVISRATGDPAVLMVPFTAGPAEIEAMRARLGLDQPLPIQFALYLGGVLNGDLGDSIRLREPVLDLVARHLPMSVSLAVVALALALLFAIPSGLLAAFRRGSHTDFVLRLVSIAGMSMPAFWLGIMAVDALAVRLGLLPTSGTGGWQHYVLPAATMALFAGGGIMRLTRSAAIEVLSAHYVLAARARGLSSFSVIRRHVLRNSLLPVVGLVGIYFPLLVSSAVVVEAIFNWPGMGRLAYQGIVARDFPVVQGVALAGSALVVASSLVVDVAYAYLDPRIRIAR